MAARGFKTVSRWFPRSFDPREDEDSNERNSLLRSHLEQIVPVEDADVEAKSLPLHTEPKEAKALALHVETKTVALKVSMHCHGCARKVEKQVSKLQGVVIQSGVGEQEGNRCRQCQPHGTFGEHMQGDEACRDFDGSLLIHEDRGCLLLYNACVIPQQCSDITSRVIEKKL